MTPAQLYALTPERIEHSIGPIIYGRHAPELADYGSSLPWEDPNKLIEVKYYKDFNFDGERCWSLASVWFCGLEIMILQNAGRGGEDHHVRFITNLHQYNQMIQYLRELGNIEDNTTDVVDENQDVEDLTNFYGHDLNDHFERSRY